MNGRAHRVALNPIADVVFSEADAPTWAEPNRGEFASGNGRVQESGCDVEPLGCLTNGQQPIVHIDPLSKCTGQRNGRGRDALRELSLNRIPK